MNFLRLFGINGAPAPTPGEQHHRITFSDRIVPYTIHRGQRRRLSLTIDHRGLRVLGPMRLSIRQAESMLFAHEAWVLKKLDEWRDVRHQRSWSLHANQTLPYLGAPLAVTTETHTLRTPRLRHEDSHADSRLILATHDVHDTARNHRALVQWLRGQAMSCFEARVALYATQLGVPFPPLALSQAKTRWGSCSSRGHIRLNWRLIHLPLPLIDYVVAHELAHLKEMNHSPRFWAVVESMYPDWRQARRALRGHVNNLPVIEVTG